MMIRNARKKLRGCGGFSFTELLACVLILTLAGGVIVETLDLGIYHFRERTRDSEAELLCNNISVALQERLAYGHYKDVTVGGVTKKIFYTGADGLPAIPCEIGVTTDGTDFAPAPTGGSATSPGMAALRYEDGDPYLLASESDYCLGSGTRAFDCTVGVKYEDEKFTVEVNVYDYGTGTSDKRAGKVFTVKPVLDPA